MKKLMKIFLVFLLVITFCGCRKNIYSPKKINNKDIDGVEYPTYNISEYSKMDKYEMIKSLNNIKYKYTYFFKENMCVNLKEELVFKASSDAKQFYDENKDSEEYMEISINNNEVTYYYNPEYFEYMMYPKDTLIELLNSIEDE